MPPPTKKLRDAWSRNAAIYPSLRNKWGSQIPVDSKGRAVYEALDDFQVVIKGGQIQPAPQPTAPQPTAPQPTPQLAEGPQPSPAYPVTPPKPVDWGERGKSLARMFGIDIDKLPGRKPSVEPVPEDVDLWTKFRGPVSMKEGRAFMKGLGTIDEIVAPARGMAFSGWVPGLEREGVTERAKALREQGFGPWASAGAAYEQSLEAGEIPWWINLPVAALTDPIELIPGIGIAGAVGRTAIRGGRTAARAATRKAAQEAAAKGILTPEQEFAEFAAKDIIEDIPKADPLSERYRQAFPTGREATEAVRDRPADPAARISEEELKYAQAFKTGSPIEQPDAIKARQAARRYQAGQTVEVMLGNHPQFADLNSQIRNAGTRTGASGHTAQELFDRIFDYKQTVKKTPEHKKLNRQWENELAELLTTEEPPARLQQLPGIYDTDAAARRKMVIEGAVPDEAATAARFASSLSGGGTVESALKGTISVHADEISETAIKVFNDAHGTNYTVSNIADDASLQSLIASNAKHYHASPVCKNFTAAKTIRSADKNDLLIARSVARNIREVKPASISLENVPAYQDTALFKMITDELDNAGYKWDIQIVDAADYGAAQSRTRMIVRAIREGDLPPLPEKTGPADWYSTIEDLIEVEKQAGRVVSIDQAFKGKGGVPSDELRRINRYIEMGKLTPDSPIITMGSSASRNVPAARNAGGPSPTLLATRKAVPRIILPTAQGLEGAGVIRVTPRMMSRLMGLSDTYKIPAGDLTKIDIPAFHDAKEVLGNGVHGKVTENFIQPLVDTPTTTARAATRMEYVDSSTILPGLSKPLSEYSDTQLKNWAKGSGPRVRYYKDEMARRGAAQRAKPVPVRKKPTRADINKNKSEIKKYINFFDAERSRVTGTFKQFVDELPKTPEEIDATTKWFFREDPTNPGDVVLRTNKPLPPTRVGWKGARDESLDSKWINDTSNSVAGRPPEEGVSQFIKDVQPHFGLRGIEIIGRSALRDMQAYENQPIIESALHRFFGSTRQHGTYTKHIVEEGSKELESLGYGRRQGGVLKPTAEHIGTAEEPGSILKLLFALHTKGGGRWLDELRQIDSVRGGDAWERQYKNLRTLALWEEDQRKIFFSEMHLLTKEDYFYRGWKRPDGAITKKADILKKSPDFGKTRNHLTFEEMISLGFEPVFWNPYEQAMLSSTLGLQARLQKELISILRSPSYNLVRRVRTQSELQQAAEEGWREVDIPGAAFRGESLEGVPVKFVQSGGEEVGLGPFLAKDQKEIWNNRWVFEPKTAKLLEDLFGGKRASSMTRERIIKINEAPLIGKFLPKNEYHAKIDDIVFLPKRAKLLGSFFQQADFATRGAGSGTGAFMAQLVAGMHRLGQGNVDEGFMALVGSLSSGVRMPQHVAKMVVANVSPGYRSRLREQLRTGSLYSKNSIEGRFGSMKKDPDLAKYTWANLQKAGLNIEDATIFNTEDSIRILKDEYAAVEGIVGKTVKAPFRAMKALERMFREGLFNGVYPAAIMHDVQYNIIPTLRLFHPDKNADEIMAAASLMANKAWSTIPIEQSVVRGWLREWSKRVFFSVAENEGVVRTTVAPFRGPEKRYWATRWAGYFLFYAALGNLIHRSVTGEWLPWDRYVPMEQGWDSFRPGYNTNFLSPDVVPSGAGQKATLDLIMQQDLIFRLFDISSGIPMINNGFLSSRFSVPIRAVDTQYSGEDFYGRDITRWGLIQRSTQLMYDLFAPIGAGQLAVRELQKAFEDKEMPFAGKVPSSIMLPGATVKDIMPTVETNLGPGRLAQLVQASGFNLVGPGSDELKDKMVENTFGGGYDGSNELLSGSVHTKWDQIKDIPDKLQEVITDPDNSPILEEIERRKDVGVSYGFFNDFSKMIHEKKQVTERKLQGQADVVHNHAGMLFDANDNTAWSPAVFRDELKKLSLKARIEREQIDRTYGEDPRMRLNMEERGVEPDPIKTPLKHAKWLYFKIRDEHTDVKGKINYDAFNKAWAVETSKWDPELMLEERLDSALYTTQNHPFVQKYYDALNVISDSGYWSNDFPVVMDNLSKAYPGLNVPKLWERYNMASSEEKAALRDKGNMRQRNAIKLLEDTRRTHRLNTLYRNPNLDALLVVWFHNSPITQNNLLLWRRLYKTPGNIRNK